MYSQIKKYIEDIERYKAEATEYKLKYHELYKELVRANKGIRRLRRKLDKCESKTKIEESDTCPADHRCGWWIDGHCVYNGRCLLRDPLC